MTAQSPPAIESPRFERGQLFFDAKLSRNRFNAVCTGIAGIFATVAVLPLLLVLLYVLVQGGRLITPRCSPSCRQPPAWRVVASATP